MNNISKRRWTKEECKKIALQYSFRKEFQNQNKNAYSASLYNGWLDEICRHMILKIKPSGYWTKERCKEEALKYKKRSDFLRAKNGAYYRAMKNGWLNEICNHMVTVEKMESGYWTKERCKEEALKYKTKKDFKLESNGAYDAAKRNGWLNEISMHMIKLGNRYMKFIYVYYFDDNHAYVGLTYDKNKREKRRRHSKNDPVIKHMKNTGLTPRYEQLTELMSVDQAIRMEGFYYDNLKADGWIMLNKAKTGSIGSGIRKWTYETCKSEASKYKNKSEYQKNAVGAYTRALHNNWLNDFF